MSSPPTAGPGKCPICGRPTETAYRPFCSRRCADVDLARWLRGAYAIPTRPDEDEDGDGGNPADGPKPDDPGSAH